MTAQIILMAYVFLEKCCFWCLSISVILDLTTGGAKAKYSNCTHRCFKDTLYIVMRRQREGRKRLLAGRYCHIISGFKAFLKIGFAKGCNFMNKAEFNHHSV